MGYQITTNGYPKLGNLKTAVYHAHAFAEGMCTRIDHSYQMSLAGGLGTVGVCCNRSHSKSPTLGGVTGLRVETVAMDKALWAFLVIVLACGG